MAKRSEFSTIARPSLKLLWRDADGFTVSYGIVAGLIGIAAVASIGAFKKKSGKAIREHAKGTFNSLFNKGHKTGTNLGLEIEKEVGIDMAELALGAGLAAAPNIIIASIRKRHRAPDEASEQHDLPGDETEVSARSNGRLTTILEEDEVLVEPGSPASPGRSLQVNDHIGVEPDRVAWSNCTFCSRTALQDERNVSAWLDRSDHGVTWTQYRQDPVTMSVEVDRTLKKTGLILPTTTHSRDYDYKDTANKNVTAIDFMTTIPEDSFSVGYSRQDPRTGVWTGHEVTAIRQDDGRILYMDFQQVPATKTYNLADGVVIDHVAPVAVDWRVNRQLMANVNRGTLVPQFR